MKKGKVTLPAIATVFMLFLSCQKDFIRADHFRNPLEAGCQVAEYHIPEYDSDFPPRIPYLFKKTFDSSGKIVREIECFFNDIVTPHDILLPEFHHIFKIEQRGRMIFLINKVTNKGNIPDTVARITLNNEGRAESCAANPELVPDFESKTAVTEYYLYKSHRIVSIKSVFNQITPPNTFIDIDTLIYDNYGNILSCRDNSYQYDYSRKAKQQFYCDDIMDGGDADEPFYLLQYLGFFPEVTSPVNIRTRAQNQVFSQGYLTNHQFDAEGKLISYDYFIPHITIVWNCKK
jgi:hypothetical protein